MKKYILGNVVLVVLVFTLIGINQYQDGVGSDAVTPIAGQSYTLAGSGVSSSDTSITLTSFTITQTGYKIQDSDMSDVFYLTLEPGSRSRQEIVSCTTVVQNSDNTATLSGCERGLQPFSPYASSTAYAFAHSGGSTVIFSNPPQLYNQAAFKDNDETITGSWLFPTPLSSENAATKAYVDSVVTGTTTLSNDRLVVAGTAGETLATSTLVYFNPSTQRWNGVSSASSTTFDDRFIGLTQGAGTNGAAIRNGVLLKGRHTLSTGLTAGATYYAAAATGTISASTSSQPIGIAAATNILYFDPVLIDVPHEMANNTFTATNTFTGNVFFTGSTTGALRTEIITYNASSTWTKQAGLDFIRVQAWGGGGSGASDDSHVVGGGGGGAYMEVWIPATQLGSTVSVTIGAGGTSVTAPSTSVVNGINGGNTTFGSFVTAFGGSGGTANGGNGADIQINSTLFRGLGGAGVGGTGIYWGGGAGGVGASPGAGNNGGGALFGAAGGGGSTSGSSPGLGGDSIYGGDGGNGFSTLGAAGAGIAPGGGGGSGGGNQPSGAGANGRIIVTESY